MGRCKRKQWLKIIKMLSLKRWLQKLQIKIINVNIYHYKQSENKRTFRVSMNAKNYRALARQVK